MMKGYVIMKMLTRLYEILLAESTICEEHLFMNLKDEVCKKILLITEDNTTYDVLIVNGEVKEIIEY